MAANCLRRPLGSRAVLGTVMMLAASAGFLAAGDRNNRGVPGTTKQRAIHCQVIEWDQKGKPLPQLTLACPPEGTYTPIRVYMVLSWEKEKDMANGWTRISENTRYETKARQGRKGIEVELQCQDKKGRNGGREWFRFTRMVRQAIIEPVGF